MFWRRQSEHHKENDSSQQDAKVKELRAALGPLSGRSLKFATDASLRRYLAFQNWNVEKSKKVFEETLKWRSTYKPEDIRWHEVEHYGVSGSVSRANFHDRLGRTVLLFRAGKQNTTSPEGYIRLVVYLIENSILKLPEGQEQISWLVDFTDCSLKTNMSVRIARDLANILQNHYPERLAIVVLYNPPRIFQAFWKAVKLFLDPKAVQRTKFVYPNHQESEEIMKSFFDVENLPSVFGGKASLEYNHKEFSRLMAEDDVKTAKFWASDSMPCHVSNGYSGP